MSDETTEKKKRERNAADAPILRESRRRSRRSFAVGAAAAAAGYGVYHWINNAKVEQGQPAPLRAMLNNNASVSRALGEEHATSPTYSKARAEKLRVNGVVGLDQDVVLSNWRLQMVGVKDAAKHPRYTPDVTAWQYKYVSAGTPQPTEPDRKSNPANAASAPAGNAAGQAPPMPTQQNVQDAAQPTAYDRTLRGDDIAGPSVSALYQGTPGLLLTMDDINQLPRTEFVTQFKCIEGWSQIVEWSGFRLRDLLDAYPPALLPNGKPPRYVYMETPDGFYYVGYNLEACRNPQTLLATHMHGAPLTQDHGAPLRIHMPIKYGYKQIKRIGLIAYTDVKPDDYWGKLGYDWFGGL